MEPIIEIKGLKKQYRMGQIGTGTLTADLQSFWARVRKKEDPNLKIGQEERLVGKSFMALNGIDLTVQKGEAVGIIGINGAGKSTLLKVISRITAPTAGEIVLRGRIASMLEVGTGFNGEMTGRENIYMNGAILGMTKAEIDAKMDDIIEFSECKDFIDTPVKRYSSGMYVKLAFAVAAHLDSEILIMDEVLAVGDVKFQKKCLGKMSDAASEDGKTVLYVSHNMATIRQLCTRCVVLKEGKVIFDGEVEKAIEIYSDNIFSQSSQNTLATREFVKKAHTKVQMTNLYVKDKDNFVFNHGENINLVLEWTALEDIENATIAVVVKKSDYTPLGCFESSNNIVGKKGEKYRSEFTITTDTLVGGRFCLDLFFYKWEAQASIPYDECTMALGFEVNGFWNENANHGWRLAWGNTIFPTLNINTTQN